MWGMRIEEIHKLGVKEGMFLRSMCRVTRNEKCKNDKVTRRFDMKNKSDRIDRKILKWF